jgi:hypothetical protein
MVIVGGRLSLARVSSEAGVAGSGVEMAWSREMVIQLLVVAQITRQLGVIRYWHVGLVL